MPWFKFYFPFVFGYGYVCMIIGLLLFKIYLGFDIWIEYQAVPDSMKILCKIYIYNNNDTNY